MNNEILLYLIGAAIVLFVVILITREIFSIPTVLRNQKAIIRLLALNAKKSGAQPEEVDAIVNEAEKKTENK